MRYWMRCSALVVLLLGSSALAGGQAPRLAKKNVLAWADVRAGYQHESISHALSVVERLGYDSGAYDTYIRTDSQLVTKRPITFKSGTGIATGEQFLVRDLRYFDAIFFFGVREIELTPDQRANLMSFVKEDGKGFVAAHSAATAFFSWPEFGEMLGGRFDEHPWNVTEARGTGRRRVVSGDAALPDGVRAPGRTLSAEGFLSNGVRVLARIDPASVDLKAPLVHRTDADFPVAWAKTHGAGRVFYSTLGHDRQTWDDPVIQRMYSEAIRWALRLVDGDATPRPRP